MKKTIKRGLFNQTTTITHRPFGSAAPQQQAEEPQQPMHRTQASGVGSTVESDVAVIFLWSVIVGLMVWVALTFAGVAICYYADWEWWPTVFFVGGTIGLMAMVTIMLLGMSDRRRLWWVVEKHLGVDLDGDGIKGAPAMTLNIEYKDEKGQFRFRRLDLPEGTSLNAFYLLASAALNDLPVSEQSWTPKRKGFSTNKFRELMQQFERAGIFAKDDPGVRNSPRRLTSYGRSVLKEFTESYPLLRAREGGNGDTCRT
jgi:hypothetical protein